MNTSLQVGKDLRNSAENLTDNYRIRQLAQGDTLPTVWVALAVTSANLLTLTDMSLIPLHFQTYMKGYVPGEMHQ